MAQKKRMAILCSTDYKSYPMGGMMSFILDSLSYLSEDFDITLWGVSKEKNIKEFIIVNNVSYPFKVFSNVKTEKKILPNMLRVIWNIWKNRKIILSQNYDVIYIHGIPLSFPFFGRKIKVVNHIHGMTNPFSMTANRIVRNPMSVYLYEQYRNWIVKKSDLILLASDKQGHEQFSNKFPLEQSKIIYVPNFADVDIFTCIDKIEARKLLNINLEEIFLINTGRISLQKDPILLIHSFISLVNTKGVDANLVMIGDGELKEKIESIVKKHNIESKVIITGKISRKEINIWLNAGDLFVYTSHANGFPISLVESAMCALPIVSTNVTGVHDLVIDNKTGFLTKNREPIEIAENILNALLQKSIMGENVLEISKDFNPRIIVNRMKNSIISIC